MLLLARVDDCLGAQFIQHPAQQAAGVERLTLSEQTLRHRLHEHGLPASIDNGRQTLPVRKTPAGCPRRVLHLKAGDLVGAVAETGAKLVR